MATVQMQLTNIYESWDQIVGLDGIKYTFSYQYNSRNDTWYMSIYNISGDVLIESIPCLTDVLNMTGYLNADALPIGETIFFDASGNGNDCTRDNFGTTILQFYTRPDPVT